MPPLHSDEPAAAIALAAPLADELFGPDALLVAVPLCGYESLDHSGHEPTW